MKKVNYLVVAMAIVALGFSSCKKEEKVSAVSSDLVTVSQDDAQANDMLDDVDNESDDVTNGNSSLKSASADTTSLSGRVVVWTTNNDGTKTATITYTNFNNPHSLNERVKNGVITIVVTGKRTDNTYKRVVTFTNFTINDAKIEGTKTVEKTGDLTYKITMVGGKITFVDNSFITCDFTRTRTQVEGTATPTYIWDDAYTIECTATGVTRKGETYTKETTSPVKIVTAYRFPVSGSFTITTAANTFSLDYGDGTMDSIAVITWNGVTRTITLRK
jgi:hypothetical protein